MEEKNIISSKQANIKLISLIIVLAGIILFIFVFLNATSSGFYHEKIVSGQWGYVFASIVPYFGSMTILPFAVIAGIFYALTSKTSLTVSNKRVFGTAAFGKRVDLPLDKISAVGTSMLKGIAITTSSGAIKFFMISNHNEIHSAIAKLLVERQDASKKVVETVVKQEIHQSNADELKKYKDLLDNNIISQEEFDAKKKQLLGL